MSIEEDHIIDGVCYRLTVEDGPFPHRYHWYVWLPEESGGPVIAESRALEGCLYPEQSGRATIKRIAARKREEMEVRHE